MKLKSTLSSALIGAGLFLSGSAVFAAPALPAGGIEVDLTFASNYVFRGDDVYSDYAKQKGKSYGGNSGTWSFQPSITFSTPVKGLTFNIWGAFAMAGRADADTDQRLQSEPGGDNLAPNGNIVGVYTALPVPTNAVELDAYVKGFPNFYKEKNGLGRKDEIDFTLDYSAETKKGNVSFGLINYVNPSTRGKDNFGAITEIYFKYALPFFTDLTFAVYSGIATDKYQYYNAGYKKEVKLSKAMKLTFGLGVGYMVVDELKGVKDVTASVKLGIGKFTLGFNLVNRPDLRFAEVWAGEDSASQAPLWMYGASTLSDGLVADPSRNNGLLNDYVNAQIGNALGVAYTPRQKLPRNLYYVTIGYTQEL